MLFRSISVGSAVGGAQKTRKSGMGQSGRAAPAMTSAPCGRNALRRGAAENCVDTARGEPTVRDFVARMAELADATDSKSVAP